MKQVLIIVDAQDDFITGTLPVPGAGEIVPVIARLLGKFDAVIYTQDWHPGNHCSFKENGGQWPRHCVANSPGSMIHHRLPLLLGDIKFRTVMKGMNFEVDSYSGFWDNERKQQTRMLQTLEQLGITEATEVYICGLATEYCVKFTAIDAHEKFKRVFVIEDACRGVDAEASKEAIDYMVDDGIAVVQSWEVPYDY